MLQEVDNPFRGANQLLILLTHPLNSNDSDLGQASQKFRPPVTPSSFSWQEQC